MLTIVLSHKDERSSVHDASMEQGSLFKAGVNVNLSEILGSLKRG